MINKNTVISKLWSQETKEYLQNHQMKHIWIVWSIARWDNHNDSDVDIMYEYDDSQPMIWRWLLGAKTYIEKNLWVNVDILDKDYLDELIKPFIYQHIIPIW